jgi:hypothetical protein
MKSTSTCDFEKVFRKLEGDQRSSSVAEHLPSMSKALGLIPNGRKKGKGRKKKRREEKEKIENRSKRKEKRAKKTRGWVWWCTLTVPALCRLRQEDLKFEASLANTARPCLKKKEKKKKA